MCNQNTRICVVQLLISFGICMLIFSILVLQLNEKIAIIFVCISCLFLIVAYCIAKCDREYPNNINPDFIYDALVL